MAERRDFFDEWFQTHMALSCAMTTMATHLFRLQQDLMFGLPPTVEARRETEAKLRVAQNHVRASAPQPPRPSTAPSFAPAKAAFGKAPTKRVMRLALVRRAESQPSDSAPPSPWAARHDGSSRGLAR